jgi:hypothetical protein
VKNIRHPGDLVLRHPNWRGLRGDKNAAQVRRDRG